MLMVIIHNIITVIIIANNGANKHKFKNTSIVIIDNINHNMDNTHHTDSNNNVNDGY